MAFSLLRAVSATKLIFPRTFSTPLCSSVASFASLPENLLLQQEPVKLKTKFGPIQHFTPVDITQPDAFKVPLLSLSKGICGSYELDRRVFGQKIRVDIVHRVVRWQRAKKRQGTAQSKGRGEVRGSTRKLWKQKGSGRARVSDGRAPHWRGGGRAFPKRPRNFAFTLPKKVRQMGLRVALSAKFQEGKLSIVDCLEADEHKTKKLKASLANHGIHDALIIGGQEIETNFKRASGNIPLIDVLPVQGANVFNIVLRERLVLSVDAVEALVKRLAID